jgi:cell division protein FtsL
MAEDCGMKRWLHAIAVVIIVVLAVGLYKAKTDASKAAAHVRELETQIGDAQSDLRALRAEIAHLESPARVEALADRHLELERGRQSTALPESAIEDALPAPTRQQLPNR